MLKQMGDCADKDSCAFSSAQRLDSCPDKRLVNDLSTRRMTIMFLVMALAVLLFLVRARGMGWSDIFAISQVTQLLLALMNAR